MKENFDFGKVVSGLREHGRYLRGICPRCGEDSFIISPKRNQFFCFMCHGGGKGRKEDFEDFMDFAEFIADGVTITTGPFDGFFKWIKRNKKCLANFLFITS